MARRISFTVEGDVQGVNYRSFAVKQADGLSITGYAKNCDVGTVQGEAQGDASAIDKFLQHLRRGPGAAEVNKVDHQSMQAKEGERGFERYCDVPHHTLSRTAFLTSGQEVNGHGVSRLE
ncbi:inducible alternative oxidase 2 [Teratosphaeriaceae sp. CCFEE 6253]|nr:inducible alternative oxidase 2 [Teratosphaeriaceae sp. CCFEE 6253]